MTSRHPRAWTGELIAFLSIGIPMGLTQLVQFSITAIDILMIGRLGAGPLASGSIGGVFFFGMWLIGFGPVMAVSPLVSQALGRDPDNVEDVRLSVRMCLWSLGLCFPIALVVFLSAEDIALALSQPAEQAAGARAYVLALAPSLPFVLASMVLRNFLAALNRTRVPLLFIVLTTALNALLNYVLIYGNWGAPRLELVGAGLASSLSTVVGFFALVAYIRWDRRARSFHVFKDFLTIHKERLLEVIRLGWPISVALAFEISLFNCSVFLMGVLGVNEVAAYQVALNVSGVAFMVPLGLSMAGGVRVGLAAGAGDFARVRMASLMAVVASIVAIMFFAVPCVVVPEWVGGLYLDRLDPANQTVMGMVALFLPIAGAFALFDAIQVAAAQCLRGLKDVRVPMVLTGISYWVIGFPLAATLGLYSPLGAIGVWWGLLVALATAAVLLGGRLWLLTRPAPAAVAVAEQQLE